MKTVIGNASHREPLNESLKNELKSLTSERLPVCVDFDGTLVSHRYPKIGLTNHPCLEVLRKWIDGGVGVILDTMRDGEMLDEAIKWCKEHGIELYGIGGTPDQKNWTTSGKAYGVLSVDDRNLGCPLKTIPGERPMVDWGEIDKLYSEQVLNLAEPYVER